jgi:hypothetical protein
MIIGTLTAVSLLVAIGGGTFSGLIAYHKWKNLDDTNKKLARR